MQEFISELLQLLNRNHDLFEKQLSYISAGSIVISMALIKDVVGQLSTSCCKFLIIVAWSSMAVSLLTNLLSHNISYLLHYKTIREIDNMNYDYQKAQRRNIGIMILNWISILFLIVGIALLIIFVSINL